MNCKIYKTCLLSPLLAHVLTSILSSAVISFDYKLMVIISLASHFCFPRHLTLNMSCVASHLYNPLPRCLHSVVISTYTYTQLSHQLLFTMHLALSHCENWSPQDALCCHLTFSISLSRVYQVKHIHNPCAHLRVSVKAHSGSRSVKPKKGTSHVILIYIDSHSCLPLFHFLYFDYIHLFYG